MQYIFWYDWPLLFFMILFVLLWANKFVKKNAASPLIVKYFKKGLILKIIGCIAYAIYHQYIYKGGDTFSYFDTASRIGKFISTDFDKFFRLTFYSVESTLDIRESGDWIDKIMVMSENNTFQVRVAVIIQLFTFGTFLPTSLIFSLLSYIGIWKCIKVMNRLYPNETKNIAIAFLYIPTVVFWGSGIGKDSVCLGSICALTASAYTCFVFKERIIKNMIAIVIFTGILLIVKPYIAFAFIPSMLLAIVFLRLKMIKNVLLKILAYPATLILIAVFFILILDYASTHFAKYAIENLAENIVQSSTSMNKMAGSAYDLGIKPESIGSFNDLLSFFPIGIITTLFRPWVWEVKNSVMLLSALESLTFLLLVIFSLLRGKLYKPIRIIITDPILFSSLVYVFVFAGLVGLSTGNFGTLVRYKLPIMPYFGMVLLIIISRIKAGNRVVRHS